MTHGPVMLDLAGTELSARERARLRHPACGGVILFSRNYADPEQLAALVAEIHALRSPPLLVAVDQEGGRVQRLRHQFTELPPLAALGDLYEKHPNQALEAAHHLGWLMAVELRTLGIDFSFAPVLDLRDEISRVIGERAFSADPQTVAHLGWAWSQGAREGGMISVGKHFPGHGRVEADSHHQLPVDPRPFDLIWEHDLVPFRHLVNNGIAALMPAHVVYSACDPEPAGFSTFWIQEVLRRRMGFQGAVISDDLSMAAAQIAGTPAQRARRALAAGCDLVLVCNDPDAAEEVLDDLGEATDPVRQARLARLHGHGHPSRRSIREDPRWSLAMDHLARLQDDPSMELELDS